jgi:ABC-2 type transport system permease protein
MTFVMPAFSLAHREVIRFARKRSRVMGALLTPIVFWVLLGAGLGTSFTSSVTAGDASYLEYFFPGTLALVVLFTAIFSAMSLIEDRHQGFLQAVLAAPASRASIAFGKITGSTILATFQGMLLLAVAPLAGFTPSLSALPLVFVSCLVMSFAVAALGFAVAWKVDSVQGFHSMMNLLLLPMWVLSGALFPADGAAGWMKFLLAVNPLTYGVAALRRALYPPETLAASSLPSFELSIAITAAFGLVCFLGATFMVSRTDAS